MAILEIAVMKIYLDKKKINKRITSFGLVALLLVFCLVMVISMNILEQETMTAEKLVVIAALLIFLVFWLPLLVFYLRLKRRNSWVIRYENGVLDDASKPFYKATALKIENIVSVSHWSRSKGINQYKIVTTDQNSKRNGLINQLRGAHFYLTDYIVDSKELYELAKKLGEDSAK